jgi:hypothetical protein
VSDRLVLTERRMKVGLPTTRVVNSLEADKDGTSGGLQRWRTRGGGDLHFHSPSLTVLVEDVGKQRCVKVVFFFLWLCALLFLEVRVLVILYPLGCVYPS